jgi:polyisoprenoid-binding protein YceI
MRRSLILAVLLIGLSGVVRAETFSIDPYHSSVSFKVKHVIGKVTGQFSKFSGTFNYEDGQPAAWSAEASIDAASVNTGIDKRDTHLRSPDFFDIQKYPTLTFKSTGVTDVEGDKAKLHGDLTMHGVTKPIVLDLEIAGIAKDPMGKGNRAGATASGHVNRLDYGVGPATGPTASMVGNDVEITIETEGVSP